MATVRSIFGSRARNTTPIAPLPSSASISYLPTIVPTRVVIYADVAALAFILCGFIGVVGASADAPGYGRNP